MGVDDGRGSVTVLRRSGGEDDLGKPREKEVAEDAASRNAEYCRVESGGTLVTELS